MNMPRNVVITGASRGIGLAIAGAFVSNSDHVTIISRNLNDLEMAKSRLVEEYPNARIDCASLDISDQAGVTTFLADYVAQHGTLDVLVNAAGIQGPVGPFLEQDFDEWLNTMKINLIGPAYLVKNTLKIMMQAGKGKIICLSGGGAVNKRPNFAAYATSKAGLVRFIDTVAEEVVPYNIQINALAPGAIATRMTEEVIRAGKDAGEDEYQSALQTRATGGASLADVQQLALFLASEESNDVTGKLISAVHHAWWKEQWSGYGKV